MEQRTERAGKAWLSAVLMGQVLAWPFANSSESHVLLDLAQREGVLALLHARLVAEPALAGDVPAVVWASLDRMVRVKAAQSLFRESQCRTVLRGLEEARIPALLLKGSALAYWAYPQPHLRECSDIDLLVPSRGHAIRALRVLDTLGYMPLEPNLPGDQVCFEQTCVHQTSDDLEVDLHWRLSSAPMFGYRFPWAELDAEAMDLPVLAAYARGLAPVPAFVHACMHRAQNLAIGVGDRLKWLFDLVVLGRRFSAADWQRLVVLAADKGLADVCLVGADAAAACFGPVVPDDVRAGLQQAASRKSLSVGKLDRWWYVQQMNFLAVPGWWQRLRWLRQRVWPDTAYLRQRYGSVPSALVMRLRAVSRRLLKW